MSGSSVSSALHAYTHSLTDGEHGVDDLQRGEALLVEMGLLIRADDYLFLSEGMRTLVALPTAEALSILVVMANSQTGGRAPSDDQGPDRRERVGALGEEAVVAECRRELDDLGLRHLANQVQRVSLVSDALGYDVVAPTATGTSRLLEVKTQSAAISSVVRVFLSRNEYEVGRTAPEWALVACSAPDGDVGEAELFGWCRAAALREFVPADTPGGRWTEAGLRLPVSLFRRGLPPAI